MEDAFFPGLSSDNSSGRRESARILGTSIRTIAARQGGDPKTLLLSRLSSRPLIRGR